MAISKKGRNLILNPIFPDIVYLNYPFLKGSAIFYFNLQCFNFES